MSKTREKLINAAIQYLNTEKEKISVKKLLKLLMLVMEPSITISIALKLFKKRL